MSPCRNSILSCLGIACALLGIGLTASAQPPLATPESVVVVANKAVEGSLKVAETYMQRRGIPEKNLIIIEAPERERISRELYVGTVHNPILSALVEKNLINGLLGSPDGYGRITVSVISNPIQYLVLCYGVPLRMPNTKFDNTVDSRLVEKKFGNSRNGLKEAFTEGPTAKNEASVDGELALLLQRDIPLTGFVPNPYYNNRNPSRVRDILKVTRLDGPSPRDVLRMLENSLKGEAIGLKGRAYVDEDGRGGNYQIGNTWFANTARVFGMLGYDLDHDTERRTFATTHRFDAPVLYAGWYAGNLHGPFALPGFQFPPGAIAAHLHSYSASTIRTDSKRWVGPLIARGVSATFGNTAEPYLKFTHQFDLFFAALAEGWNFGDAAYLAIPALSWQNVSIGDPLFRPFAVSLEEQGERIGNPLNILSDQYVVLRRINQLEAEGDMEGALRVANRGMRETPGPALGLKQALLLEEADKKKAAREALSIFSQLEPSDPMEWGLYAEMADTLMRLKDAGSALRIYQNLERQQMPENVQLAFLKRGIQAAEKAGESRLAIEWQARVTPPPPPPPPPPEQEESVPVSEDEPGS